MFLSWPVIKKKKSNTIQNVKVRIESPLDSSMTVHTSEKNAHTSRREAHTNGDKVAYPGFKSWATKWELPPVTSKVSGRCLGLVDGKANKLLLFKTSECKDWMFIYGEWRLDSRRLQKDSVLMYGLKCKKSAWTVMMYALIDIPFVVFLLLSLWAEYLILEKLISIYLCNVTKWH